MKRVVLILAALAAALPSMAGVIPMGGAFLRNEQKRDSVLLGDRLRYGFRLEDVTEDTGFTLPDWSKGIRDSVETMGPWQADTLKTRKLGKGHKVYDIEMSIPLASFDEGIYELPEITVLRTLPGGQTDTLVFESKTLDVRTLPIDIENFQPNDLKPQIKYPVTFSEVLPYAGGVLGLGALVWLILWLVARRKRRLAEENRQEPPHIVALRKLDMYRSSKFWAPDKQKAFYSGVTDALREYMARRYEFGAMEMTTAEIFDALKDTDAPEELLPGMKSLFETSDFVKFAKLTVDDSVNATVLPTAVKFVTDTYIPETEEADAASLERPAMEYDEDLGDYIKVEK